MKKDVRIQNHKLMREKRKGKSCSTNLWKNTLPKESTKKQKVTNAKNLISQ